MTEPLSDLDLNLMILSQERYDYAVMLAKEEYIPAPDVPRETVEHRRKLINEVIRLRKLVSA